MRFETLRKLVLRYPFRPVQFTLDDGTRVTVRHPEAIMLGRALCGVVRDPEFPLLFEPEKVLAVQHVGRNRSSGGAWR